MRHHQLQPVGVEAEAEASGHIAIAVATGHQLEELRAEFFHSPASTHMRKIFAISEKIEETHQKYAIAYKESVHDELNLVPQRALDQLELQEHLPRLLIPTLYLDQQRAKGINRIVQHRTISERVKRFGAVIMGEAVPVVPSFEPPTEPQALLRQSMRDALQNGHGDRYFGRSVLSAVVSHVVNSLQAEEDFLSRAHCQRRGA